METKTVVMFPKQYEAINFTTPIGAIVAGVQSGKTFTGAHWSAKKMVEFPTKNGIIAAPTYKILQHATLPKLFDILPQLRKYHKEQKGEITLPTGGTVFIRSMENPLGAEGISAHWVWGDEAGMYPELAHNVLRSRVSMTRGQILYTTTPYNMGWMYKQIYQLWKGGDKDISFFSWASIENPLFGEDYYDAEKRRLPPEEFARRYMGEFRKMVGLVYDIPESQIIAPIDLRKKAEARIMGIDWGFRNPAALSVALLYDGIWYIPDEWKRSERTTAEIIQVAQNMIRDYKITKVYPDPAEPDRIEECRRAGIPVYETDKDILGGISYIKQLLYEKRFFVFNTCTQTIDEASMYHYPEPPIDGNKAEKEEPEKFNDHLMDAMRYAIFSYQGSIKSFGSASPLSKPHYPEIGL